MTSKIRSAARSLLGPSIHRFRMDREARAKEQQLRALLGQPDFWKWTLPAIRLNGDFQQSLLTQALFEGYSAAVGGRVKLPESVRGVAGMSGQKYRELINVLIGKLHNARYLEVGSWAGSTATAALWGNALTAVCIDNWSQFGGPREAFLENTARVMTSAHTFRLIESDFRDVDYSDLGSFNVYLFDGPHHEQDQYDGITIAAPALDDEFILIVDDWNWRASRIGTFRAVRDSGWLIKASLEIRTTRNESHPKVSDAASEWHNGYLLAVVRKSGVSATQ